MPDARTEKTRPEPLRLTRPEAMVEARPAPSPPPSEDIFLSPRVLDAGAFGRYADMLRSLIGDARQGAQNLQDFAADAGEINSRCEKTGEVLRTRMEAGARMVKLIDDRADRAERLLDLARTALPDEAGVRARIESSVRASIESAQARVAEATVDAERRARGAATEIERKLAAMSARADEQAVRLERVGDAIDQRLAGLEARLTVLTAHAESAATAFEARLRDAAAEADARLDPVLRRAAGVAASIDDTLSDAWRHADERAGKLTARLTPLQTACDAVLARLGVDGQDADPAGSVLRRLETLVARSETSLGSADRVLGEVNGLTGRAEDVKARFGEWLLDAAARLDTLEERRALLTGPLAEAAEKVARVSPRLADDLELASTRLDHLQTEQAVLRQAVETSAALADRATDRLNNQSSQLRALIDGSVRTLTARVEEAGVWLAQLIARAEEAGGSIEPMGRGPVPTAPTASDAGSRRPVTARPEPANSFGLPMPLPIDNASFDGAPVVFGQPESEPAD